VTSHDPTPQPTAPEAPYRLRLFVAGDSPKSRTALANLHRLCELHIPGRYEIEVIDLAKNPSLAKTHQILAIPTLVRSLPEPAKRVIGDLSDADKAYVLLDLDRPGGAP
jgi:circadian clock protein KaiB